MVCVFYLSIYRGHGGSGAKLDPHSANLWSPTTAEVKDGGQGDGAGSQGKSGRRTGRTAEGTATKSAFLGLQADQGRKAKKFRKSAP